MNAESRASLALFFTPGLGPVKIKVLLEHFGKVWNFPGVGQGHVDFAGILGIFERSSYRGPFTVEIEFYGEPWPALADVNAAMKQSYQTLAALGLA